MAGATPALSECPRLLDAIENVLRTHVVIESTVAIKGAMKEIGRQTDLDAVFLIPMRHKILGIDGALKFALFLRAGAPRIIEEEKFAYPGQLDCARAFDIVITCFDMAAQDLIWDHVEESYEASEDSDDVSSGSFHNVPS